MQVAYECCHWSPDHLPGVFFLLESVFGDLPGLGQVSVEMFRPISKELAVDLDLASGSLKIWVFMPWLHVVHNVHVAGALHAHLSGHSRPDAVPCLWGQSHGLMPQLMPA